MHKGGKQKNRRQTVNKGVAVQGLASFQCFITHHKGEYTLVYIRVTVCIAVVVMRFLITVLLICFNKNISLHYLHP